MLESAGGWVGYLVVAVLDAVEVENGEGVGGDEAGQGQDLVHLDGGY